MRSYKLILILVITNYITYKLHILIIIKLLKLYILFLYDSLLQLNRNATIYTKWSRPEPTHYEHAAPYSTNFYIRLKTKLNSVITK